MQPDKKRAELSLRDREVAQMLQRPQKSSQRLHNLRFQETFRGLSKSISYALRSRWRSSPLCVTTPPPTALEASSGMSVAYPVNFLGFILSTLHRTVTCSLPHLPVVNKFLRFWPSQTDWNWLKLIKIDWNWLKMTENRSKWIGSRRGSGGNHWNRRKIGFAGFAWKVGRKNT